LTVPQTCVLGPSAIIHERELGESCLVQTTQGTFAIFHNLFSFNIPSGLGKESLRVLSEMSGIDTSYLDQDGQQTFEDVADAAAWEDLPSSLKDNETFVHAARDLTGS
jgi:hypothetical protein